MELANDTGLVLAARVDELLGPLVGPRGAVSRFRIVAGGNFGTFSLLAATRGGLEVTSCVDTVAGAVLVFSVGDRFPYTAATDVDAPAETGLGPTLATFESRNELAGIADPVSVDVRTGGFLAPPVYVRPGDFFNVQGPINTLLTLTLMWREFATASNLEA